MYKFEAGLYMTVCIELERLASEYFCFEHGMLSESDLRDKFKRAIIEVGVESQRADLEDIVLRCERFARHWSYDRIAVNIQFAMTREILGAVQQTLLDRMFLGLTRREVALFKANPFSSACAESFPSAEFDMLEAGKCLALERYTASVFHCMRVLESVMVCLCMAVDYVPRNPNWQNVLNELPDHIKKRCSPHSGNPTWKEDEHFYSELMVEFRHFKNAWRNYVMHNYEKYTDKEAEEILEHVRSFASHAASRLKGVKL